MTENTYSEFDFDYDDFLPPHEPEAPADADTGPALPFALSGVDLLSPPGFVGQVTDWIDAQCRYPRRRLAVAAAEERKNELLEEMTRLAGDQNADFAGRKLTRVEKAGAVSYAKALKALAPDADLEPWRGKPSSFWQLR